MNCRQFNEIIIDLACELPMDGLVRSRALEHAEGCVQCSLLLARQQNIAAGLQALALQERKIDAPAGLGIALQAAFERQMNGTTAKQSAAPGSGTNWLPGWMNLKLAAAFATLTIFFAAAALLYLRTRHQDLPPIRQEVIADVRNNNRDNAPLNIAIDTSAKSSVKIKRGYQRRVKAAKHDVEDYGAFLSLAPITQAEPEEYQQVVRMQIPRALLRLWKLPVNEESTSEHVSADVFFSEDGVARAIRLLN